VNFFTSFPVVLPVLSLLLGFTVFYFSRRVHRKLRVTVHRALFESDSTHEYYFVNVTNLSLAREVEITHVWFDTTPNTVHVLNPERPLSRRLKGDEEWSTWIPVTALPTTIPTKSVYRLARVRISTGKVFKSMANEAVPSFGAVPGGSKSDPPNVLLSTSAGQQQEKPQTSRYVELLNQQLAEEVESLRYDDPAVDIWWAVTQRILEEAFGKPSRQVAHFVCTIIRATETDAERQFRHGRTVADKKSLLKAAIRELELFPLVEKRK